MKFDNNSFLDGQEPMPSPAGGAPSGSARAGRSAEYSVSLALVAVCLTVGAAIWLLRPKEVEVPGSEDVSSLLSDETDKAHDAEQSAMVDWNRRLQQDLDKITSDHQLRQQQAAMESQAEQARQTEETLRQQAETARQAAAQAAANAERLAVANPTPSRSTLTSSSNRVPVPLPSLNTPSHTTAPVQVAKAHDPVVVEPKIDWSSCSPPEYPTRAAQLNQEGTVLIRFTISSSGQVVDSGISTSSGYVQLDQAALKAMRKCNFTPGTKDGVAEGGNTVVSFRWSLR